MERRSGLGRGLDALIPQDHVADVGDGVVLGLQDIPIDSVVPNRFQPREGFDEASLDSLAMSVRELGVLQPILVRAIAVDGTETSTADHIRYELIAGERRWRAARRVGMSVVPAIVRAVDDQNSLEQAVVENLHRENLNPLEEAAAYQQLIDEFSLSQLDVAKRVGKSRPAVANTLRLFQLPPSVQRFVLDGSLTAGHARALLGLDTEAEQLDLVQAILAEGLNVRQVEAAVRGDDVIDISAGAPAAGDESGDANTKDPAPGADEPGSSGPTSGSGPEARLPKAAALLELEQRLANTLQTSVDVSMGVGKGKIVIDFADLDDLERLYHAIIS